MNNKNDFTLAYASEWEKVKELSWSGTTYSLLEALKKDVEVEVLDITIPFHKKVLAKLSNYSIFNGRFSKWVPLYATDYYAKSLQKKYLDKIETLDKSSVILQIACIDGGKGSYYTYQDLNFEAMMELKKYNRESFNYSGYENLTDKDLSREANKNLIAYKNATGIFTMGKWLEHFIVENMGLPKEKVHAVGGGCNIDISKISPNRSGNKFLFIGKDFPRKGGPIICEAFNILKKKYMPSADLYVIGPIEKPKECNYDGIKYMGELSYDELIDYYNSCDVFCMPSYFEAYGLVFCEALIFGLPCLGRRVFEMEYFIEDGVNGTLISEETTEEVAKKMFDLISNNKIKRYVKNNRDYYINEYSWDAVAKRMLRVIEGDRV
ncbi:glycosyltransferase family 4 protein [Gallicola sp. Sow4_E12]|uniref:glycosyltransferase family 4 protein n=1 Tax=Gallicola sp. Sow4_E12 TaxID=3438785 RepID=UPI003F91C1BC